MTKILGLDLGTNSIGWALVDEEGKKIIKAGSRIIPMDAAAMGKYEAGNLQSQASVRTGFRSVRRMYERAKLRRSRLLRVLNIMDFLPEHYRGQIDFVDRLGQFKEGCQPLLPYRKELTGKNEFIFMDSFREMLSDFAVHQPSLVNHGKKIPYDWTIYYLRRKALSQPISRQELAWIILQFNAKRGYYQRRSDEGATTNANEEYKILTVVDVKDTGADKKNKQMHWYEITYENGGVQKKQSIMPPKKPGDVAELIVSTKKKKDGSLSVSLREPREDDWTLLKKRTESQIEQSHETVGEYIYTHLLGDSNTKVRGKLVRTIDRAYYKKELEAILEKQKEFIPELSDRTLLMKCTQELYRQNKGHAEALAGKDLIHLLVDDIIFYHRPLKSKKSEIADCPLERYRFYDKAGQMVQKTIKCTPKSDPMFQEFRLWQFLRNLRILAREKEVDGRLRMDVDVTEEILKDDADVAALFQWLSLRRDVKEKQLLEAPVLHLGKQASHYRWNYAEDYTFPCCETRAEFYSRLSKVEGAPTLSHEQEQDLWHILYSVDDVADLRKALRHFASKNGLDEHSFVNAFCDIKPFEDDYASFSHKAIRRLLPLMRCGQYWDVDKIDNQTRRRIDNIIDGVADDTIAEQVREKLKELRRIEDFKFLPLWKASYLVYNRHSETSDLSIWQSPDDIDDYLKNHFKQHALRNPVVEAVLGEAMRVVRDIWKTYGKIEEIHIEMGRDLKQNNKQRAEATRRASENQRVNTRIKWLLSEFAKPQYLVENVRPQSPSQTELLKIYEDGVLHSGQDVPDDIQAIADKLGNRPSEVSASDIKRYRLWLEQGYKSPYTGQPIPLSKLFTPAYEIEHIIPQARYYDDSLSNKVICESEVNKAKGCLLAYEFIQQQGGAIITATGGRQYKILDKEQYFDFVNKHYASNRTKMRKLLMDEIPQSFIQRQLTDTRYIARKAIEIFSHLVREDGEAEAMPKRMVVTNGSITTRLKKDWGMNDVWNDIVAPRFERLNRLLNTDAYGEWTNLEGNRFFRISVPLESSRNFSKKRLDHRHHAMDAIVIACTTRDHVNLINNSAAFDEGGKRRYDLRSKLCEKVKTDALGNYVWRFRKPWDSFTQDSHAELDRIVASFKQNLRVINRMTNYYWKYVNGKKQLVRQTKGDGWAVRKSLHKATVAGAVRLQTRKTVSLKEALADISSIVDKNVRKTIRSIIADVYKNNVSEKTLLKYFKDRGYKIGKTDIRRLEVYKLPDLPDLSASRVMVDASFNQKTINAVTDSGIRTILTRHLEKYRDAQGKEHPEQAFSPEGLARMNADIQTLNGGKPHKPIVKVRKSEALGMKFPIGESGANMAKYVEADKGTNLFFAVYVDEEGKRDFESIPFNVAVERMKQGLGPAESSNKDGKKLLFVLSPFDIVALREGDESTLYRFVSSTKKEAFFLPVNVSAVIENKKEYGSMNKTELTDNGLSIKQSAIKIEVDRLGNPIQHVGI